MDSSASADWSDSLERYVFVNYMRFLTAAERHGWDYFIQTAKAKATLAADHSFKSKEVLAEYYANAKESKLAASRDPVIKKLIEDYPDQFFVSVTYRILRDHAGEVKLTLCPKCLNLCGTPKAELCLRCGHSWHPERKSPWAENPTS
jgi:hypothetical protein